MKIDISSLPLHPVGGPEYWAPCPFCGKNYKFYVNLEKGVFLCHKCGVAGRLNDSDFEPVALKKLQKEKKTTRQTPIKNPVVRDRVYRQLFQALSLSKPHLDHLLHERGFDAQKALEYRSLGQERIEPATQVARFCNPSGVPGFYPLGEEKWCLAGPNGLLIPVKNFEGLIWGIQIRRDKKHKDWPRYQWLSSRKEEFGTAAKAVYHVVIPEGVSKKTLWVTEGPLKAEKGAQELRQPFVAIAGVTTWKSSGLVEDFKKHGVKVAPIAFDMDALENKKVARSAWKLHLAFDSAGIKTPFVVWDPKHKGIDDLLLAGGKFYFITPKKWGKKIRDRFQWSRKERALWAKL